MTTEQYSIGYDAGYQDGFDEALAEPVKQEPVAYRVWHRMGGISYRPTKPSKTEYVEWDALYADPVQPVDLTDDDKAEIECALNMAFDLLCKPVDSIAEMYCFGMGDCDEVRQQLKNARAVIAADREKNK